MYNMTAGDSKTATVQFANTTTVATNYTAELYFGISKIVDVQKTFTIPANGSLSVPFTVVAPTTIGVYDVYIDVYAGTTILAHYLSTTQIQVNSSTNVVMMLMIPNVPATYMNKSYSSSMIMWDTAWAATYDVLSSSTVNGMYMGAGHVMQVVLSATPNTTCDIAFTVPKNTTIKVRVRNMYITLPLTPANQAANFAPDPMFPTLSALPITKSDWVELTEVVGVADFSVDFTPAGPPPLPMQVLYGYIPSSLSTLHFTTEVIINGVTYPGHTYAGVISQMYPITALSFPYPASFVSQYGGPYVTGVANLKDTATGQILASSIFYCGWNAVGFTLQPMFLLGSGDIWVIVNGNSVLASDAGAWLSTVTNFV